MNEEEIFQVATGMPAAERAAYLATACEGQSALRERVERLLASHDHDAFMQRSADRADSPELEAELARLKPEEGEDRIGNYKLLQKIGEGGFGTVWMAEQLEPVRRRVALKIIKLGMDTKEVIVRFEQERQALALMDHSNIAKVFDAGVTPLGRPFFVMELVRGIRITDFCDQNNLPTKERLDLFIAVCNAIQHAHQKGIIHRDIKPSNILVTLHDGVPVPKVIDFGVAKAIQSQRLTDLTFFTRFEQMIGTPLYMSPEQAEMSGLDIDTRSDIYSLGVLLYELLTGRTPFDPEKLKRQGLDEMRRTIREQEPPKPSTFVSTMAAELRTTVANHRQVDSIKLLGQIRGDLDWIVMKALEKDRTRRYETANGLALDIQRHLQCEPVLARPPTPLYRFHKMVHRNQLAFSAAGAVLAALLLGLFFALLQTRRAINAEQVTRWSTYAAQINVAFHALAENNLGQALDLLNRQRPKPGEDDLRGFEWRYLWQLCQGDEFATFHDEGARAAAFSPDGRFLVYSGSNIVVRESVSLKEVVTLPGPADTLSFAPHTNLLASGSRANVKLWDTITWREVRSLNNTMMPSLFSPDGRWLLTGVAGAFRLWDTQTWQPVADCTEAPQLAYNARNAVAFSPDSQFLVTVAGSNEIGGRLRAWRLSDWKELPELRFGPRDRPGSVAFSADGTHLVTGLWDGQLVVQDFALWKPVPTPKEHTAWVTKVAVVPDGKTIVTGSSDRTINVWDATTFTNLVRLRGHVRGVLTLAVSPDGRTIVSGGGDRTTKLWHTDTRHTAPVLEGAGLVAGFTRDGRQLVAALSNRWSVWTPETGARMDFPTPTSRTVITSGGPSGKPYDVKPGEPLGAIGRADGAIEIWHLTTGDRVSGWPAHDDGIGAVAFSPDGNRLATGSIKGEVKVWNFATQREVGRFGPVDGQLFCLAFSPDGSLLATPSLGNEVRLWQLPSGRNTMTLFGHVGGVTAATFSPDGKTLATAGTDMKVKLWSIATQQELATFPVVVEFPTLSFSPDGRMLAVGEMTGDNRRIQILQAPSFEEIAAVEAERDPSGPH